MNFTKQTCSYQCEGYATAGKVMVTKVDGYKV